jgi:hypothetical protein
MFHSTCGAEGLRHKISVPIPHNLSVMGRELSDSYVMYSPSIFRHRRAPRFPSVLTVAFSAPCCFLPKYCVPIRICTRMLHSGRERRRCGLSHPPSLLRVTHPAPLQLFWGEQKEQPKCLHLLLPPTPALPPAVPSAQLLLPVSFS